MGMDSTSKLLLAFVTLILGAVLIGTIATNTQAISTLIDVTNEEIDITTARIYGSANNINVSVSTFTIDNPPTSWKVEDCPIVFGDYGNSTTVWTLDTDYTVGASAGTIHVLYLHNILSSSNLTYSDYEYCGDDYLNLGWGRTLVNLIGGFFALALLGISAGLFYSIAKDNGIA